MLFSLFYACLAFTNARPSHTPLLHLLISPLHPRFIHSELIKREENSSGFNIEKKGLTHNSADAFLVSSPRRFLCFFFCSAEAQTVWCWEQSDTEIVWTASTCCFIIN